MMAVEALRYKSELGISSATIYLIVENESWSIDFMIDCLMGVGKVHGLCMVGYYNCEYLGFDAARSLIV